MSVFKYNYMTIIENVNISEANHEIEIVNIK